MPATSRIGPTNDRSVVGVMNKYTFLGKFHWQDGLPATSTTLLHR